VHENTHSNSRLAVQIIEEGQPPRWVVPFVIEPSAGVERAMLAVLNEAYTEETLPDGDTRLVLKLKPHLSPIKAAVIPLAKNKPELVAKAQELKAALQKLGLGRVLLEMSGNVGKAYRKHDEIGTPVCLTIDFQTLDDATVTLRHRDTMQQERLPLSAIPARLAQLIKG
jgi:glycyl-tRNA synthetase